MACTAHMCLLPPVECIEALHRQSYVCVYIQVGYTCICAPGLLLRLERSNPPEEAPQAPWLALPTCASSHHWNACALSLEVQAYSWMGCTNAFFKLDKLQQSLLSSDYAIKPASKLPFLLAAGTAIPACKSATILFAISFIWTFVLVHRLPPKDRT